MQALRKTLERSGADLPRTGADAKKNDHPHSIRAPCFGEARESTNAMRSASFTAALDRTVLETGGKPFRKALDSASEKGAFGAI